MFKNRLHGVVTHLILLAGVIFLITPIVLIFVSSTHQSSLLGDSGLQLWPGSEGFKNFTRVLTLQAGFTDQITALDMMKNSLIIATGVAFLTTIVSLCAAYGMVYFKLRIANFVFWLTLATLLLPLESRFITTFLVTDALGLINTHCPLPLVRYFSVNCSSAFPTNILRPPSWTVPDLCGFLLISSCQCHGNAVVPFSL